jgi:hypothetical protein
VKPRPARRISPVATAVVIALGGVGCSTSSYEVKVDAISKPSETASAAKVSGELQSYKIKSKNPAVGEENLRYKEAAEYVKTALSSKGLYEAPTQDRADMIVDLDYGIDAPRTKIETVSVPVYAQTGGGVRYEQVPVTGPRGTTSYRTVAVYEPPRTELIGYDDMPQQVTIYEKYLRITARENKPASEGRAPAEVWSVSVSTEDECKDLRKYLPILASATADYIGKDSTSQRTIKIKDPSQITDFIRKGMNETPDTLAATLPVPPKS